VKGATVAIVIEPLNDVALANPPEMSGTDVDASNAITKATNKNRLLLRPTNSPRRAISENRIIPPLLNWLFPV
jgi:hypothetical protein